MIDSLGGEDHSFLFPILSVCRGGEMDTVVTVFALPSKIHQELASVFENVGRIEVSASMRRLG
jgi:hypothetical protein